jgi:LacI family repressor for deo operon, udp, cdd, tsx, nupC, and nupG
VQISDSRAEGQRVADLGHDGRADGIVLLDGSLDPAIVAAWRLPVVQLCEWNDAYGLPGFGIDNAGAARMAVDHLADLGHRHMLHVEGPPDNILGITRKAGFLEAAHDRGIAPVLHPGDFTLASGIAAARSWAEMEARPTAAFCASDECAFGFISECDRLGYSVPGDISVVGFDDIDFADCFIPPLTTIHQPRARLGRRAAKRLVAALQDNQPMTTGFDLIAPHFVVRLSTRRL